MLDNGSQAYVVLNNLGQIHLKRLCFLPMKTVTSEAFQLIFTCYFISMQGTHPKCMPSFNIFTQYAR